MADCTQLFSPFESVLRGTVTTHTDLSALPGKIETHTDGWGKFYAVDTTEKHIWAIESPLKTELEEQHAAKVDAAVAASGDIPDEVFDMDSYLRTHMGTLGTEAERNVLLDEYRGLRTYTPTSGDWYEVDTDTGEYWTIIDPLRSDIGARIEAAQKRFEESGEEEELEVKDMSEGQRKEAKELYARLKVQGDALVALNKAMGWSLVTQGPMGQKA